MTKTLSIILLAWLCVYLATLGGMPVTAIAIFVVAVWGIGE